MKQDIVVGCIDLYEFDSLKNWIYSLNESGFDGRKILVCYRISDETIILFSDLINISDELSSSLSFRCELTTYLSDEKALSSIRILFLDLVGLKNEIIRR